MAISPENYVTVTAGGATYGVGALCDDDGVYRPSVAELDPATGDVRRTIVDGEWTDEGYADARECLLRAVGHVL